MFEILQRVWENLLARTEGPLNLRFFLQPTISIIFAIRAAMRDAKAGTAPYLQRYAKASKAEKKGMRMEIYKDVGKIFVIGTILDITYQLIVIFKQKTQASFYPLESLLVAFLLAIVPYLLLRGPVNRLIRYFTGRSGRSQD
ncbi:hypothetical protein [Flavihumibacter petaseus]|uniref:Uncharacterized protein n=1 Tax=Flavihumibacter petaseus NBRC 106054 TaxID=1220578 RepID=A0A0E9N3P6_9BACT|nr:hypothetical protein [Flavihumibacter petaseus]GAO43980.1 hypothetical protein FPE01S_03_00190 [Flavihumibacter petaseus NBRC 106054]